MADMLPHMLDRLPDGVPHVEQLIDALRMVSARVEIARCKSRQEFTDICVSPLHSGSHVEKIVTFCSPYSWRAMLSLRRMSAT